jgi:hypothetical protein
MRKSKKSKAQRRATAANRQVKVAKPPEKAEAKNNSPSSVGLKPSFTNTAIREALAVIILLAPMCMLSLAILSISREDLSALLLGTPPASLPRDMYWATGWSTLAALVLPVIRPGQSLCLKKIKPPVEVEIMTKIAYLFVLAFTAWLYARMRPLFLFLLDDAKLSVSTFIKDPKAMSLELISASSWLALSCALLAIVVIELFKKEYIEWAYRLGAPPASPPPSQRSS